MKLLGSFVLSVLLATSSALASDEPARHNYQSDVARLRKIVINSLYSHKEIFLRELISNANDALEKLRLTSLTDKNAWDGSSPLNITIQAIKDEEGSGGRIVISDTGIGMTPDELQRNLGTLAKSGTSEFLARAEDSDNTNTGNLIGAFGLGFYSSFLVADRVQVASIAPKSERNPTPEQHIFSSASDESSFEIYADPRGNTIGRGTEITLFLKEDALEYLDTTALSNLVYKHSSFSSTFPIYLFTQENEEVPDVDETEASAIPEETAESKVEEEQQEDEMLVEDDDSEAKEASEAEPPKTKTIVVDKWVHLNSQPPIWTRDPKTIDDEEYKEFYRATFKDFSDPLAWYHFSGESGSGVPFKSIIFIPSRLDNDFWHQPLVGPSKDVRLMVKRTFITSDLGEDRLPKWASWVKVVVDAEDLPLNVSRETLQSNAFLKQMRNAIIKRIIQLMTRLAEEEPEKFETLQTAFGPVLKLGSVEDTKNREKLLSLVRFTTSQRNMTSLEQYAENRKIGQKQIFYLAEMGKSAEHLAKSVFIEKLHARGYEVLLLSEPLDEILVQNVRKWKSLTFQDVAKAGLKFGDENSNDMADKVELKNYKTKFQPLLDWLLKEAGDTVRDVVISNRLVTSPCAIVADQFGYTANVEKMMNAQNKEKTHGMHEFAKKQKLMEINPRSPLIEGLLKRVQQLPAEDEEPDLESEEELKEVASILIDGALVRSGFEVPDSNVFFSRVDRVLRRSLGVSETAPTDSTVRAAPPVDPELPSEDDEDDGKARVDIPEHMQDDMSIEIEELDDDDNVVGVINPDGSSAVPPQPKETAAHDEL